MINILERFINYKRKLKKTLRVLWTTDMLFFINQNQLLSKIQIDNDDKNEI